MADFFKIGQAAYGGGAAASKAIGEGLQKGQQVFMAYLTEQKAKREKADNITKQYLAQIPNVNSITKIPEWMRTDVNNYLVSEKEKYTEVAKQLSTMSSRDPRYMDAVSELQNIKNNFAYLNDQLNDFQEKSKQYVLDVDNDKISEGFKDGQTEKYDKTAAIYTGNAKLNIQNGNLFFNVDGKSYNYSRGEIGDYFTKNFSSQTALLNLAKQVETDARKGFTFESARKRYEGEIDAFLNKGGKEAVLSMVYDTDPEFITGGGLKTPDIQAALLTENYDAAARLIKVELMRGVETEHASVYKAPEPKTSKLTLSEQKRLQILDLYNKSLPQIRPTLTSFLNSNKTAQDAINNFSKLGLNVTDQVQDDDGNIIAITVKHGLVDEPTQISLTDPVAAEVGLSNALGYSILGGVYTPQTTTEPEQTTTETATTTSEKIPGILEEGQYPENFANLDTTEKPRATLNTVKQYTNIQEMVVDAGVPSARKGEFARKVQKELKDFYGDNYSEANINKAIFDVVGRKNYNEKLKSDFEKGVTDQASLENIQKASTTKLTRAELKKLSSSNLNKILKAVNKTQAIDLTEQDILIAAYIQETGDTIENINTRLASSNLPII